MLIIRDSVVRPAVLNMYKCCRSRKCIRWHIPMHAIFAVFYLFFLPVLSRPSLTSRTLNKDQKIEQLFYCPVVQAHSHSQPLTTTRESMYKDHLKQQFTHLLYHHGEPGPDILQDSHTSSHDHLTAAPSQLFFSVLTI